MKESDEQRYDDEENIAMQSLFLSGTYPDSVDLSTYIDYWNVWNKKEGINYLVAEDINNIQAIYQFCNYYKQYPDKFTDDDVSHWLSGIGKIETDLGKQISEKLIKNNPLYSDITRIYFEEHSNNY